MMHRVTARGLNLREGPGTQFPITRELPRHTALVIPRGPGGAWLYVRTFDSAEGWVWPSYTVPDPAPWLSVAREEAKTGVAEVPGVKHNARILEYHGTTTLKATEDEVPWCSAFANWCTLSTGILGTRLANARSWLRWGKTLAEPVPGCIVILSRGVDPSSGHVGFYVSTAGKTIRVLGGNQGNQISEAPYARARVLGFRWPIGAPLPGQVKAVA